MRKGVRVLPRTPLVALTYQSEIVRQKWGLTPLADANGQEQLRAFALEQDGDGL